MARLHVSAVLVCADLPHFSHSFITGVFWVWFRFELFISSPSLGTASEYPGLINGAKNRG